MKYIFIAMTILIILGGAIGSNLFPASSCTEEKMRQGHAEFMATDMCAREMGQ